MFLTDLGRFQSRMDSTFLSDMDIPSGEIMYPRNSTSETWKYDFLIAAQRLYFLSRLSTSFTNSMCSSSVSEYIRMSSRYMMTPLSTIPAKTVSIFLWKVAGALQRPCGITRYWYSPYLVRKA